MTATAAFAAVDLGADSGRVVLGRLDGGSVSLEVVHRFANRPVRLLMTSRDVIHSFFVPDFRIKQDVLPGRYTETWF